MCFELLGHQRLTKIMFTFLLDYFDTEVTCNIVISGTVFFFFKWFIFLYINNSCIYNSKIIIYRAFIIIVFHTGVKSSSVKIFEQVHGGFMVLKVG